MSTPANLDPPNAPELVAPGANGVVHIVAIPRASITEAKISAFTLATRKAGTEKLPAPKYKVTIEGVCEGLPDKIYCRVQWLVNKGRTAKTQVESEGHGVAMSIPGWDTGGPKAFTMNLEVPLAEAGLTNNGQLGLRLFPAFPFCSPQSGFEIPTSPAAAFDHPLAVKADVDGADLKRPIGGEVDFQLPAPDSAFKDCWLRVTITEEDISVRGKKEHGSRKDLRHELVWEGLSAPLPERWRVGCSAASGAVVFEYAESREAGDYEFGTKVDLSDDKGETWYPVPELRNRTFVTTPKPELVSFSATPGKEGIVVTGKLSGFHDALKFPLDVSLWQVEEVVPTRRNGKPGKPIQVVNPLTGTVRVSATAGVFKCVFGVTPGRGVTCFSVLSFPDSATQDTDSEPPAFKTLAQSKDEQFPRFNAYGPVKSARAVAVGSGELNGKAPLVRRPAFAKKVSVGVYGEDVIVRIEVFGGSKYWKAADPVFAFGAEELKASVSTDRHRPGRLWVKAKIKISDAKVLGKTVTFRARVKNEGAKFRRATVAAPSPVDSRPYRVDPRLSRLDVSRVPNRRYNPRKPDQHPQSFLQVTCHTESYPTRPANYGLRVCFEKVGPLDDPGVPAKIAYAIRAGGSDGMVSADGKLVALVKDADSLRGLRGLSGSDALQVVVYRHHQDGTLYGRPVIRIAKDL